MDDSGGNVQNGGKFSEFCPTCKPAVAGQSVGPRVCKYCRGGSHWKDQCPLLKSKLKHQLPSSSHVGLNTDG